MAVEHLIRKPTHRIVCVREVQLSLKESVKRLVEDKIERLGVDGLFKKFHDRIETSAGGIILFQGMKDHTAESIKSLEGFDIAYVEEAQTLTARSLEFLRPTIRNEYPDGTTSEIWFSWNPRSASDPVDALLRGPTPPSNSCVVKTNYTDNPFFPAVLEEERVYDEIHARERYGHIWLGDYEPKAIGAIWDRLNLHQNRRDELPELGRILVGVDHAVSADEGSNEHGIIVAAQGSDKRGYVLEDATTKGSPERWASRAISAYDHWEADGIVIETNQGGDLVKGALRAVRPTIPIIEVRATKGKHVRAEPISALYSMGRISHVGAFPQLEDQMCQMTASGYEGEGSPDRVDALVWVLTKLFPSLIGRTKPKITGEDRYVGDHAWLGS